MWPRRRLVVLSSADVYRAYESRDAGDVTDAMPLDEESPVRSGRHPYRGRIPGMDDYEKLDVEAEYLARNATVLRLAFVYGPFDAQRREDFILRRVRAKRSRIPIGSGTWLLSRLFVDDAARAIRLTAEAQDVGGEVFNVAETKGPHCTTVGTADPRARQVPTRSWFASRTGAGRGPAAHRGDRAADADRRDEAAAAARVDRHAGRGGGTGLGGVAPGQPAGGG